MTRPNPLNASELRRQAESRLREKQPSDQREGPEKNRADTLRLVHELEVHQIELELQNEELRQARAEKEAALTRYTDLYEFAPVGYLPLDRPGVIRQVNITGSLLLATERVQVLDRRLALFVSKFDQSALDDCLTKVWTSQEGVSCEVRLDHQAAMPT